VFIYVLGLIVCGASFAAVLMVLAYSFERNATWKFTRRGEIVIGVVGFIVGGICFYVSGKYSVACDLRNLEQGCAIGWGL